MIAQGLEPRTCCLEGSCSIQLSYATIVICFCSTLSAERGGFEPPVRFLARMFSKHVVSATHPPLRGFSEMLFSVFFQTKIPSLSMSLKQDFPEKECKYKSYLQKSISFVQFFSNFLLNISRMNKTQILIALVIISIFGVISTYLDVSAIFWAKVEPPEAKKELKDGEVRQYTKDKRLKTVVNYDEGVKHGTSYLYHDDGKTILLEMPYNQGKREGVSKKYYENGELYASTSYSNNKLHGPRKLYYTSGQLKAEINYGNGHPGLGTVEYLLDGSQKEQNKITTDKRGRIIAFTTEKPCKDMEFFIGKLIDDEFFNAAHPDIRRLPKKDGSYFIDIDVYTPSYLKYQDIICHCKSKQGNPLILKTRLY